MNGWILVVALFASGIETDYSHGPVLSSNEEVQVVELAHLAGMTSPVLIRTYYLHPSDIVGIAVIGAEKRDGRKISYRIEQILHDKWKSDLGVEGNPPRVGPFLHRRTETIVLTVLLVNGQEYRLQLDPRISILLAEKMLSAVLEKRYSVADDARREFLEEFDLSTPTLLRPLNNGNYSMGFPCLGYPSGDCRLELSFQRSQLVVHSVDILLA